MAFYLRWDGYAATGEFPATDPVAINEKGIREVPSDMSSPLLMMEDFFITEDPGTGKKTWEYHSRAEVDAATGAHQRKEFRGDIYTFPRNVRKQTYRYRWNYVKGVPLAFLQEEDIEGIPTFVFDYKGRGEYTEAYTGTAEYPGVKVAPGQEIRCRDDQYSLRLWVEPVTGEILKMDESCRSGDYVYESVSGKRVAAVLRWSSTTSGDDVVQRAEYIRSRKQTYIWMVQYMPWGLALGGLLVAISSLMLPGSRGWRDA